MFEVMAKFNKMNIGGKNLIKLVGTVKENIRVVFNMQHTKVPSLGLY